MAGSLQRLSFGALVSVQFHLPRLTEAFWLLETLAHNPCRSLRKLIDRQSRWRPREQRFDGLDVAARARAAELADALGGGTLRSLRHLEGPVFALLLRARGSRAVAGGDVQADSASAASVGSGLADSSSSASAASAGIGGATPEASATAARLAEPSSPSCDSMRGSPLQAGAGHGFGEKLEVAHLVDSTAQDLLGFWEPLYPRLQKLVLLNLPASSPGRTVTAVADFLPKVPNLAELQLDFQFFDPATWELDALEALVERAQAPPCKVSKLMLEWCRLGDAGVRCVCQALARHTGSVTELSLAHCELRDVGSVCEMLETPDLPLTKLDLSSNSLDDRQATRLAKSLPHSKVKELRLRDSLISVPLPVKTSWFWGC